MSRRTVIAGLKVVVTVILLYLFIHRTNFTAVAAALSQLSVMLILTLATLNLLSVFISAYKWRMLLPEASFRGLLVACFASYYVALLLPGQVAQEAAKAYYLSRGKAPRLHRIAASVIVDKIVSIIGLLVVGCVGLAFTATRLPASLTVTFVITGLLATAGLFSLRASWIYSRVHRFLAHLEVRFPAQGRIVTGLSRVFEAWHIYSRKIPLLMGNIAAGVIYQLVGVLMFYLLSRELNVSVGFFDWSWMAGALTLALFMPLTIGGLGVREGTLIGLLAMYGCPKETALALSFVAFSFVLMLAIIGAGLSFAAKASRKSHV